MKKIKKWKNDYVDISSSMISMYFVNSAPSQIRFILQSHWEGLKPSALSPPFFVCIEALGSKSYLFPSRSAFMFRGRTLGESNN